MKKWMGKLSGKHRSKPWWGAGAGVDKDVGMHSRLGRALAGRLGAFWPAPVSADWRERLRVTVGAALGIGVTAVLCHALGGSAAPGLWLVAPMGASAVLVFGVPASPLAQPWAVLAGNALSALVGVACVRWLGHTGPAAALAVGLAIGLMFALRCLHPPGGASALLVVLTGVSDPAFALSPVLLNSAVLVAAGIAYNHATGRAYPHRQVAVAEPAARDSDGQGLDRDLDAVLARYNQVLDISRDDLKALLEDTRLQAYQRRLANLRCSDIMSRRLFTVGHGTPLAQAWSLFRAHRIKALPVVDSSGGVIGIVTPADFMRAAEASGAEGASSPLGWGGLAAAPRGVVGDIMTRRVRVAGVDRHLADLIPLFGGTGHHHIPIVDTEGRLAGMLTQSDVVGALTRTGPAQRPPAD